MGDLTGKVALITGSGRGMGRAHALVMAGRGADIVIHDILKDEAAKTAEDVRALGRKVFVSHADVSDVTAMKETVAEVRWAGSRFWSTMLASRLTGQASKGSTRPSFSACSTSM